MQQTNPDGRTSDYEVAVVGLGPAGATLANLLGLSGVRTVVIEREDAILPLPRAVSFDDEAMRIFQTMGLAEAILPLTVISQGTRFVDREGRLLLDWSRPPVRTPQGWHAAYRFHQPELEEVLRQGLRHRDAVELRPGTEAVAADITDQGVRLELRDTRTAARDSLTARYVVGCDGARSVLRRWIAEPMEDLGFHERWLVVDAILTRPCPELGDHTVQHCDPERPSTYVRGTGDRRRWEISLKPGDDLEALSRPDGAWTLLSRWITPEDAVLERSAIYTFHSTIARCWRRGPLLIAGDAAHQTPPFLGQGMCAGIRDAANLAWKLAAVLRGEASERLLDSYGTERAPHVRGFIEEAVRIGGLINATAMEAVVPGEVLRGGGEAARFVLSKPVLGPGPRAGWTRHAGRLAPQPRLQDGTMLDDRVGYRFALVARADFAEAAPCAAMDALAARGAVLVADGGPGVAAMLQEFGVAALLLRPDRHVMGAARDVEDLRALAAQAWE
jgi:3-(3-hydroxy-phenyl)propionate hydroxylase